MGSYMGSMGSSLTNKFNTCIQPKQFDHKKKHTVYVNSKHSKCKQNFTIYNFKNIGHSSIIPYVWVTPVQMHNCQIWRLLAFNHVGLFFQWKAVWQNVEMNLHYDVIILKSLLRHQSASKERKPPVFTRIFSTRCGTSIKLNHKMNNTWPLKIDE